MRSLFIILALLAGASAAPTPDYPVNGQVIGPCNSGEELGTTLCDGTGFTKCGHAGHFFFDCGAGTTCVQLTPTSVTCGT